MPKPCRDCKEPIRFIPTAASGGRVRMTLDLARHPDANVEVVGGRAFVLTGDDLDAARAEGRRLWIHHKATCPAEAARRARDRNVNTATGRTVTQESLL